MVTIAGPFDNEVHAPIEFPLDSVRGDFPLDGATVQLLTAPWPNAPGDDNASVREPVTVYAGVATYLTVEGDFKAGTYYAQVRLTADDAYDSVATTDVFRLVIRPSVEQ